MVKMTMLLTLYLIHQEVATHTNRTRQLINQCHQLKLNQFTVNTYTDIINNIKLIEKLVKWIHLIAKTISSTGC